MASTFENNLRLEEIGTGEQSGTWGTKTNVNLELITDGLSYSSTGEAIANAAAHTITMADGVADEFRSFYLKCTGGGQACTVTLAPNTLSKVWVIENTTSYTLTFSQGSGANVAILAGQVKMIATDGAGSGAAVFDLMQDLAVPDLFVDDDLKLQSDGAILSFGADGDTTLTHTDGSGLTLNSANKIMFRDSAISVSSSADATLDLAADGDINLTAGVDINIPANVGLTFGNDAEKIEGDGTDLTIAGNNINLTAVADIVVPANVSITFGTGEKIEGDNTDITITSGADINLTATADINVPSGVGITFGDDGEKIEGDGTDLTINASNDLNLTAATDINIPANVGLTFGDDGEKIEGDGTNLAINSSGDVNITATTVDLDGNLEVSGTITLGSGAVISEAELELLDGVTAGTAIASKVVTTDANIDTTGQRNLTITGELDAATGDFSSNVDIDGDLLVGDDLTLDSDAAVLGFGADTDVTLTHVADTGLLLNSTMAIQFNDASQFINAPSATVLDINATDEIELNATLVDVNANLDVSGTYTGGGLMTTGGNIVIPNAGNIGSASDTDAIAIAADGQVTLTQTLTGTAANFSGVATATTFEPDGDTAAGDNAAIGYTAAEGLILTGQGSTTDVVIKNDGDQAVLSVNTGTQDVRLANNLLFTSDDAIVGFGADNDTTLTHTDGAGLTLNSTNKIMFNDASQFIQGSSATVLSLGATDEIDLTATAIDINGTVDMSSTLAVGGVVTANAGVVVDNITIDGTEIDLSSGDLTIDVAGDIILDADGADFKFRDGGAGFFTISNSSLDAVLKVEQSNEDFIIKGNDGGSEITALTLDMSEAGAATFNVGGVFNESGADSDFRVESDSQTHAFFVDASANHVGIRTSAPQAAFQVNSVDPQSTTLLSVRGNGNNIEWGHNNRTSGYYGVLGANNNNGNPFIAFSANANSGTSNTYDTDGFIGTILRGTTGGELSIEQTLLADADDQTPVQRLGISTTEIVVNEASTDTDFRVESDSSTHALFVDAGNDVVGMGLSDPNSYYSPNLVLAVGDNGGITIRNTASTTGTNYIMFADGDSGADRFRGMVQYTHNDDRMVFSTNATGRLELSAVETVFNNGNADTDFRVESDNNANMIYVDAGADHVNIGSSTDRGGLLNVDGATKGIVVRTTNSAAMELIHADNDAGTGPIMYLNRPSSSPAADDQLGRIVVQGKNSADEVIDYVRLVNQLLSPTDGSEQGRFAINTMTSGTQNSRLNIVNGESVFNDESVDVDFRVESNGNANMLFVDAGADHVSIGSSSDYNGVLNVFTTGNDIALSLASDNGNALVGPILKLTRLSSSPADGDLAGEINFSANNSAAETFLAKISSRQDDVTNGSEDSTLTFTVRRAGASDNALELGSETVFNNGSADRDFRVESDNNANALFLDAGNDRVCIGNNDGNVQGFSFQNLHVDGNYAWFGHNASNTNEPILYINRQNNDGSLVKFYQATSEEGSISVSGSTVSFNGFSGRHESSGIPTNTAKGTVVSTIDALDVYPDTQLDPKTGEPQANPKAGQTRADHAKVEISSLEGDTCVYGVVSEFDSNGKVIVTSVGIGSVRVTGACSKGDLLESNGDGTAKVQSDDIVRSKTLGKVTIGNSNTGVKLVSCVMYCG